jgi:hypothetical protein
MYRAEQEEPANKNTDNTTLLHIIRILVHIPVRQVIASQIPSLSLVFKAG